ncbi:hypothetical protein HOU39_gp123 [Lactobacillus phage Iacchus]|uniref:Uncharacterized protein n=1 Tax=Lactobacillus phage Iacchus TaxID=2315483 RepID=A0A3S7UNZ5_9CAUD|nr:hypothetical protein HOU39_gp123 [Lactobacillus phage Iacchus]AYH92017.1 hypothetical protein [Lactobacillus phage Iacchus]AYH92189.1 hypothetical protein [Lactobacillus phage Dionysus]
MAGLVKNKTNLGGLTMKFSEALQAMLDGKKVTRVNSTGYGYIMLNDDGDVVGNTGSPFSLSKKDFIADWEIADIPSAGALLTQYGSTSKYRLIKEADGTYAILDDKTFVEIAKGIDEGQLVSMLNFQSLSIASKSDKNELDEVWNVARKHHNRLANTEGDN